MRPRRRFIPIAVAMLLTIAASLTSSPTVAGAAEPNRTLAQSSPLVPPGPSSLKTLQKAADPAFVQADQQCSKPIDGKYACTEATYRKEGSAKPTTPNRTILPFPQYCSLSEGGRSVANSRDAACRMMTFTFTTYQIVSGATRVTGVLTQDAYLYSYSSRDLPNFAYQIGVSSVNTSWGDATKAVMTGTTRASGDCTTSGSLFAAQPVLPYNTMRAGESMFNTTATAAGAIGRCTTWWDVRYQVPGYSPGVISAGMNEIRCDNAVGGYLSNPVRVGCAVPWYPAPVYYDSTRNPTLADHVRKAQGSGLPGANINEPLYRSTDAATNATNRRLACGNPPTIAGKSCDEYPLATTYNGLAFGGTLRSFSGCNINAPTDTGPVGASACMINEGDNDAQGGIMSGFYYYQRVLDWDPFVVTVL